MLVLAFLAVALNGARHFSLVPPDTAHYAVVARNLLRGDGYTESFVPYHPAGFASLRHLPELHGLLRPLVLAPLLALLGPGPLVLRLPGLFYVALTGLVVFCWGRRTFGRGAGLLGCALTLLNVNLLWFGLLGADDVGFAFFFTAALALVHHGTTRGGDRYLLLAGLVGAIALLEKLSGVILLAVFLAAVLRRDTEDRVRAARRFGLLYVPVLASLGVYLLRNYVAYGSVDFRFGAFNWIGRVDGHEGWSRVFERTPSLIDVWTSLGWRQVVSMAGTELVRFTDAAVRVRPLSDPGLASCLMLPAFVPALALCGIPLYARRMPVMTALFVASVASSVGFICLFYTALVRYFSMLIPLFALWAGGVLALGARWDRPGRAGTAVRAGSIAAAAVIVALACRPFVIVERGIMALPDVTTCRAATEWITARTRADDRIMAFDPWFLAWAADRETIMIPSGGIEAIETIARRYDAHWVLAQTVSSRPLTSQEVMGLSGDAALRVRTEFDDGSCRVYRLDWEVADAGSGLAVEGSGSPAPAAVMTRVAATDG